MMRKLDRYRNVLEVQDQLGNSIALVSPSRELLKRVKLMKISSTTNRCEERILFVFNDLILLCSERAIGIGGKFKLRAIFDPFFTQVTLLIETQAIIICFSDLRRRQFGKGTFILFTWS
jgi:hypothetical protein